MKTKFILDRKSFCAKAAIVCMLLAIAFRAIGTLGNFDNMSFFIYRFALPAASCLLFIICILLFGKKAFGISFIPVIIGIVFFVMRILGDDNITDAELAKTQIALCITLYILIAVLYSCTVFGAIKTKIFLVVIFGLAFLYHIVFEDYRTLMATAVPPKTVFMELGVISIILGMFFASLGLKKQTKASDEKSQEVAPPLPGNLIIPTEPGFEDKKEDTKEPEEVIVITEEPAEKAEDTAEQKEETTSDAPETDK